ncbi:hypothetical protein Taro_050774 [Colocasia esculenta]|uniref:Uncharacterized protein n=1 Tax=Colocasia esculenta TaxID=4460 RepID=A0A843XF61_COLES|nr:hypothetical protein [Colocasia esculenta]
MLPPWFEVSIVWLVVVALPSRLRCIAWLPCVLVRFPRIVGCCLGEVRSQDCSRLIFAGCCATSGLRYAAVVLVVAFWWVFPRTAPWWFWWRFSQNQFVLLPLFVVFSLLAVCLGCVLVMVPRMALGALGRGPPQAALCLFCLSLLSLCRDELSPLPVGLSMLQSAWALSVKV